MAWLQGVGIPYLAFIALAVVQGTRHWKTLAETVLEMGVEACILGLGVTGSLFATVEVSRKLGEFSTTWAIVLILIELIIIGLCMRMRNWRANERTKASVSLFLGFVVLGINSAVTFWSR